MAPSYRSLVGLIAALFLLSTVSIAAQAASGRVAGTVRDAGGAPLVGATIEIRNQATGARRFVRSSAAGTYEATGLEPGVYALSVEMPGFRPATRVVNLTAASATADFALEVRISETVTVTAMKREESVLDTPVSIAAPSEGELRQRGVENLEQIAANVPGLAVQNLGPGQNQVSIRGVSSGQIARDQPGVKEQVGAYLDESVISLSLFTPDLDLFDMNRVEVLRGPQGTLFGSGSVAGTIRYISNPPERNATRYFGEVTGNTLTGGSGGGAVKAGVNAPLGDRAALRLVGYYDRLAGWMDAVQPDLSIKNDVNTGDRTGVRAALQIAPHDSLTITPRVFYQKVEMDGWNLIDIYNILANPFTTTRPAVRLGKRQLFTQMDEPFTDEFWLGDVNVRYDFGDVTVTSISSYTHRDILVVRDTTALTASYTGATLGLPEPIYTLTSPLDDATTAKGWTQELRVSGGPERLRWVGGAFYGDTRRAYGQNVQLPGFEDATGTPTKGLLAPRDSLFFSDLNYKFRQFAVFGEGTLSLTDRLSFTAGLRYYDFRENKRQIFDGVFANPDNGRSLLVNSGSTKADGVAPRFIASYQATPETTLNAQVSKGFRLGGINDPLNLALCSARDRDTFGGRESWEDETAWNYEIGSKSRLLGGRGALTVSAFYIDIRDLQVTVTAGTCSSRLVFNVPKARSVGGELELSLSPSDRFDFAVSAGYNDATLRSTLTSTDLSGNVSVVSGIRQGNRLPSVPRFQTAVAATYQQPITPTLRGYLSGTYTHVGSRFTQVGDEEPGFGVVPLLALPHPIGAPLTQATFTFDPELPAYDLVNLRLGVRFDNFDVALFANNVTDERALLALDRERGLLARVGYLTNEPRTVGITTRVDF